MFRIEMLPAREGDCLILTYGEAQAPKRVLIDGGRRGTYDDLRERLSGLPEDQRRFELLIVTHVDRDHIGGVLKMLEDDQLPVSFKEVWFNGFHHLNDGDFETFSPVQGEALSADLARRVQAGQLTWNGSFGEAYRKAAALPADGSLLDIDMGDGMQFTLLSPSREKMQDLIPKWERECLAAGLVPGSAEQDPPPEGFEVFAGIDIDELAEVPFEEDPSAPNGSSIAILAQYRGRKALLAGDAHTDLLKASLGQLQAGDEPLRLDAFKIPHHGSRKNLSKELLAQIDCRHFLVSTSGAYFRHPDPVAMGRLIKYGGSAKDIWFNYASEQTLVWDVPSWKEDYGYGVHYPEAASNGYQVIDLE